ncbi:MAG: hypothetical protein ACRDTA_16795 [Pseudonocardiaceae bacterium]
MAEVSVGAWIAPRLGPFGGWVGSVAPRGYAAYARVLHPVPDDHDAARPPIRWVDVCAATGRQPYALMQWHAIAGVVETRNRRTVTRTMAWPGDEPDQGNLKRDTLLTLCRVLTAHTAPDQDCSSRPGRASGGSTAAQPSRCWAATRRSRRRFPRGPQRSPAAPAEVAGLRLA